MRLQRLSRVSLHRARLPPSRFRPAHPPPPIKRTILQKFDVPTANYETITGVAELSPSVNIGRHTHFGPETG